MQLDPRTLVRLHALGRAAVGAAFTLAPGRAGRTWIGRRANRPESTVLSMAFGGRDLGIALGVLHATSNGYGARPWIQAGVLADAIDFAATYRARRALPASAAAGVLLVASGSVLLGAWLHGRID
jgi:hypothetical protein